MIFKVRESGRKLWWEISWNFLSNFWTFLKNQNIFTKMRVKEKSPKNILIKLLALFTRIISVTFTRKRVKLMIFIEVHHTLKFHMQMIFILHLPNIFLFSLLLILIFAHTPYVFVLLDGETNLVIKTMISVSYSEVTSCFHFSLFYYVKKFFPSKNFSPRINFDRSYFIHTPWAIPCPKK